MTPFEKTKSTMRKEPNAHKLPCTTCILLLTQEKIINLDTKSQKTTPKWYSWKARQRAAFVHYKKVAQQSKACQWTFMASKTNIFLLLFLSFLFIFSTKTLSATHNLALASASSEAGKWWWTLLEIPHQLEIRVFHCI